MFLYLGLQEDKEIFNLLREKKIVVKKQLGELDFKRFVIHDMKSLDHYSCVVVDLNALIDTGEDIIESISAFKMLYKPKLTLIIREEVDKKLLYRIVNEIHFYNLVITTDTKGYDLSFRAFLESEAKFQSDIRVYINKLNFEYDFPYNDVKILVGGIGSTLSSTKIALNVATYLNSIGSKVSFTEIGSGYLKNIGQKYNFTDSYKDIDFFFKGDVPLNYNFNIISIGILKEENRRFLDSDFGNVKIIVSSIRVEELTEIIGLDSDIIKVLIYNNDKEKKLAVRMLNNLSDIYFIRNNLNFFDTKNKSIYHEILKKYIVNTND